jgi:hypothetical protein
MAFGDRAAVPQHPSALLGASVHAVVQDAHSGRIPAGSDDSRKEVARSLFDGHVKQLYDRAHPLVRVKFPSPERIPFYHMYRERAVLLALDAPAHLSAEHSTTASHAGASARTTFVEQTLRSRDGLLLGRPDYVDAAAGEVIDYKTGSGPDDDPDGLLESEARQLRLYIHLAHEAGLHVDRGAVIRADGRRAGLDVAATEAAAEGRSAREALAAFNAVAGQGFSSLAAPSPTNCRYCPCIPLCEPFWEHASAAWAVACGAHAEGVVGNVTRATMQSTVVVTLDLTILRGTVTPAPAVVQQLPEKWVGADGAPPLAQGDVIRIVDARCEPGDGLTMIQPDRVATTLWTVSQP